jgi:hypothetical protein
VLDGRKLPQKLIERLSPLEIVEQCLDWHSRDDKHQSASKSLGVGVKNGLVVGITGAPLISVYTEVYLEFRLLLLGA